MVIIGDVRVLRLRSSQTGGKPSHWTQLSLCNLPLGYFKYTGAPDPEGITRQQFQHRAVAGLDVERAP